MIRIYPCLLILIVITGINSVVHASTHQDHVLQQVTEYLSSKSPYYPQQAEHTYEKVPLECELMHINGLFRHGSRHMTGLAHAWHVIDFLQEAKSRNGLTDTGKVLLDWTQSFIEQETPVLGELADRGKHELAEIAARLWEREKYSLQSAALQKRNFVFESTFKRRTQDSRDAFLSSFRANLTSYIHSNLDRINMEDESQSPESIANDLVKVFAPPSCEDNIKRDGPSAPVDIDHSVLRFYDICADYNAYKKTKWWQKKILIHYFRDMEKEITKFMNSSPDQFTETTPTGEHTNNIGDMLQFKNTSVGSFLLQFMDPNVLARLNIDGFLSRNKHGQTEHVTLIDILEDIYHLCQIQFGAYGKKDGFCSFFDHHIPLLHKLEFLGDIDHFFKKGGGDPRAYSMACTLLEDFFAAGDAAIDFHQDPEPFYGPSTTHSNCENSDTDIFGHTGKVWFGCENDLQTIDSKPAKLDFPPFGVFRFAHAETVAPFAAILGLFNESWRPSMIEQYHAVANEPIPKGLNVTFDAKQLHEDYVAFLNSLHEHGIPLQEIESFMLGDGDPEIMSRDTLTRLRTRLETPMYPPEDPRETFVSSLVDVNDNMEDEYGIPVDTKDHDANASPLPPIPDRMYLTWKYIAELEDSKLRRAALARKHPSSGARLLPMAANVQWYLYDCPGVFSGGPARSRERHRDEDAMVMVLVNERQVHLPPCPRSILCPWRRVKEWYRRHIYSTLGIETCSIKDWERACDGALDCSHVEQ